MNDLSMSNPRTKIMVWSLVFILIAGAFYWYLIKPQFESVKQIESQIQKQQQKLATLQFARQREKVILAENEKMKEQISKLKNILPTERNEFLFSEEFQAVAKLCGVTLDDLQFSSNKRKKGAPSNTVPFTVQVSADKINNINYFFVHLANFPQIINLDTITVSKGGSLTGRYSSSGKNPDYSLNVSGVIYLSQRK